MAGSSYYQLAARLHYGEYWERWTISGELLSADVPGFFALLALFDAERDLVAFVQAFITIAGDGGIMDENVLFAPFYGNKTEPLHIIEPLDNTAHHLVGHALPSPCSLRACRRAQYRNDGAIITSRLKLDNELV